MPGMAVTPLAPLVPPTSWPDLARVLARWRNGEPPSPPPAAPPPPPPPPLNRPLARPRVCVLGRRLIPEK